MYFACPFAGDDCELPIACRFCGGKKETINIGDLNQGTLIGQSSMDITGEGNSYNVYLKHIDAAIDTIEVAQDGGLWALQSLRSDGMGDMLYDYEGFRTANKESVFFRESVQAYADSKETISLNEGVQLSKQRISCLRLFSILISMKLPIMCSSNGKRAQQ